MKSPFLVFTLVVFTLTTVEGMEFRIETTWDSRPIDHDPVEIKLSFDLLKDSVLMEIKAPFFDDPAAPNGEKGKPFPKLWDYEVVEAFFLGKEGKYLEVEFSPHGQHLLLLLDAPGQAIKQCLPVKYDATIDGGNWLGVAVINSSYFPPAVNLFNAYAIHGSGDDRTYESLYPVPTGHFEAPNFHRLEFFKHIDFYQMWPSNQGSDFSYVWKEALADKDKGLTC